MMNDTEKTIEDSKSNFKITGYNKIFCNPKTAERLSKEFPNLTFTTSTYVEENQVILANIPGCEVEN